MTWFVTVLGSALAVVLGLGAPASAASSFEAAGATSSSSLASAECKYLRAGANNTISGHCRPAAGKTHFSVGFRCFPDTTAAQRYHGITTTTPGGWIVFGFNSQCWGSLISDSLSVHDF